MEERQMFKGVFYNFANSKRGIKVDQIESYKKFADMDRLEVLLVSGRTVAITDKYDIETFIADVGARTGGGC